MQSAPHDWLFRQCLAAVHYGGVGTTGAGLRAGKSTIICPFFNDQPFWGKQVFELGVGPRPIPQKQLTVSNLSQAMQAVAQDTAMQQRANALRKEIRAENGVMQAVEVIREQFAEIG